MTQFSVATWNIHKGVRGVGPRKRLEIHDIGHAVEQLDADVVCLQEVRSFHHKHAQHFERWPEQPQADYLAPEGYHAIYRTNAFTEHGEHGNAVLTRWAVHGVRHEDMSDHRFEQRGLLHVKVKIDGNNLHVIVLHLGLIAASRRRQIAQLGAYLSREVPSDAPLLVAGDFNDWGQRLHGAMQKLGLHTQHTEMKPTFPSRFPLLHLDRVYVRGLHIEGMQVPRGRVWMRMSDHLPLLVKLRF
jgi:endonuclease/exonuclease/phosphatase family metal-dependent hydrolase